MVEYLGSSEGRACGGGGSSGLIDRPGFYSMRDVCTMTGMSRATIYRKEAAGTFPRRVQIGEMRIGFRKGDYHRWEAGLDYAPKPIVD